MKVLRIANVVFAVVVLSVFFYNLFINRVKLDTNYTLFLAFAFLLFGIEDVLKREKGKKPFNLYLLVAIVLFLGLGGELVGILE